MLDGSEFPKTAVLQQGALYKKFGVKRVNISIEFAIRHSATLDELVYNLVSVLHVMNTSSGRIGIKRATFIIPSGCPNLLLLKRKNVCDYKRLTIPSLSPR